MNVCINTDASYSKKLKRGTFAYWIVSDLGRIKGSGPLKGECLDSSEAEMKAIVNALAILAKKKLKFNNVFINTDSMNAIHVFNNDQAAIRRYCLRMKLYKPIRKKYHKIRTAHFHGAEFIFAHVRAHTTTDTKRTFVNDWLDTAAKGEMKKLLDHEDKIQRSSTEQVEQRTA